MYWDPTTMHTITYKMINYFKNGKHMHLGLARPSAYFSENTVTHCYAKVSFFLVHGIEP